MNFISYPIFLIINALLGVGLIGAVVFNGIGTTGSIILLGIGLVLLAVSLLSKNKQMVEFAELIDVRITGVILFILALLLTFSPYLLSFVDDTLLVITTTTVAAISLISFVFADLTLQDEDEL
jgi:hypothetical protein